jgi:integrase
MTRTDTKQRERGEGRVYQRGPIWWIGYSVRGQERRESSQSTVERDAVKLLRRRLGEVAMGQHRPDAEKVTFDDLETLLTNDYTLNGRKSVKRVEQSLVHLRGAFGEDRALYITPDRLTAYAQARVAAGAALATAAYELALLRRAFSLAVQAGRLPFRPTFPTFHLANTRTGFFEEPEFRALLAELPAPLRPVMVFAYFTGWRIPSEILTLTWAQVDLQAGIVRLDPGTTKNTDGRTFPVSALPELATMLQTQREATQALERRRGMVIPWVFHRDGQPIRRLAVAWAGACKRAGLVGRIGHDFRRTAVRNMERAGVPRSVAMKLVGHKTEVMYRRYAITNERDLAEGVAKLAALPGAAKRAVLPFPGSSRTKDGQKAG